MALSFCVKSTARMTVAALRTLSVSRVLGGRGSALSSTKVPRSVRSRGRLVESAPMITPRRRVPSTTCASDAARLTAGDWGDRGDWGGGLAGA
jgi:hypothetical protein